MFWVIVLLEPVTIGESAGDERDQSILQDGLDVKLFAHDPCKHNDRSGAPRGNTSPHMSLERVLGFGFKFWTLPFLCKTNPAMALLPDGTLVCKEHVFERLFRTSATLREG